jgi:hypothetical protein
MKTVGQTYLTEKWGVGSRQDQEPLTFSTVPGRRVKLPKRCLFQMLAIIISLCL